MSSNYLNSSFGTRLNTGIFTTRFNSPSTIQVKQVQLTHFYFPNSLPLICDYSAQTPPGLKNNIITINSSPYTIPTFSGNAAQLVTIINTAITSSGVTATYSSTNGYYTFTGATGFTMDFSAVTSPYFELGFNQQLYSGSSSYTSSSVAQLSGSPALFIRIREFTPGIAIDGSAFNFVIPNNIAPGGVESWGYKIDGPVDMNIIGSTLQIPSLITIEIWQMRAGTLYPTYSDNNSYYCITLKYIK